MRNWQIVSGKWKIDAGHRLIQTDTKANITHVYTKVEQSGRLFYEFEVGYIAGLEDEYGGFGCHILVDKPTKIQSWGHNRSFLFWFTYDRYAYKRRLFYFQIYKSSGPTTMTLIHDARQYPIPAEYLSPREFKADRRFAHPVKIRFSIDTTTGKGKLYTSADHGNSGIEFDINDVLPAGYYFSFRTNHMAAMFDNLTIFSDPEPDSASAVREDASLANLSVSRGTLDPPFAEDITDYTLAVDNTVSEICLTPDAPGMITMNNEIVLSRKATEITDLKEGENRISILVTATDAVTTREYTIAVIRSPAPAGLLAENPFQDARPLLFSTLGQ